MVAGVAARVVVMVVAVVVKVADGEGGWGRCCF